MEAWESKVTIVCAILRGIGGYEDGRGGDVQFSSIDGMAWAIDSSLYITVSVYVWRVAMDGTVTTLGNGALPFVVSLFAIGGLFVFAWRFRLRRNKRRSNHTVQHNA